MLTHYTKKPEGLVNILSNGFVWIANRRELMRILVPEHDFSTRESQQFGMISFTDITPDISGEHSSSFGKFGIAVTEEWASRNKAQKVLYIDSGGPITEALKSIYQIGYLDCKARIKYPDDAGWNMAYENKTAASSIAGAYLWANLLGLYEYMESSIFAKEREWRITNPNPHYGFAGKQTEKLIEDVFPPEGWAQTMNVVKVSPNDVDALVCPSAEIEKLQSLLPTEYGNIPIIQTN